MPRFCRSWLVVLTCVLALTANVAAQSDDQADDQAASAPVTSPAADASGGNQSAESDSVEQARQLFNEGLHFVEVEDWQQAEDRFRRVLALKSSHVAAYNLASALVHLERLVESSELLRVMLRDPSVDPTTHDAAQQLLSEIEPRIGSLTVRVSGDSTGATLLVDDKPLELSAAVQAVSVDPGSHHVTVKRADEVLASQDLVIGGDAPLRADITLELPSRISPKAAASAQAGPARPHGVAAAPVRQAELAQSDEPPARHASLLTQWWLWTGVGAAVAAGAAVLLLGSSSQAARPVAGDTDPPFIRGQVRMGTP